MKIEDKVKIILKKYEESRNSDLLLYQGYLKIFHKEFYRCDTGGNMYIRFNDMSLIPAMGTIVRWRASLQSKYQSLAPTNKEVFKKRSINKKKWMKALGYE